MKEDLLVLLDAAELIIRIENSPAWLDMSAEIVDDMESILERLTLLLKNHGWVRDELTGGSFKFSGTVK